MPNIYGFKGFRLSGSGFTIQQLMGPIVYILYSGSVVIYVGKSDCGCGRIFDSLKERYRQDSGINDIEILSCETRASAAALETQLIRTLHPKLNVFVPAPLSNSKEHVRATLKIQQAIRTKRTRESRERRRTIWRAEAIASGILSGKKS